MKRFRTLATPVALGALMLGLGLGVSSLAALGASHPAPAFRKSPDKKGTCDKPTTCVSYSNKGAGEAILGTGASFGVVGVSTVSSSSGYPSGAAGLYGYGSSVGIGVYGYSLYSSGGVFESGQSFNYGSLQAISEDGWSPFSTFSLQGSGQYLETYVDGSADGYFDGYVEASGYHNDVRTRDGRRVAAYDSAATRAQIEDVVRRN